MGLSGTGLVAYTTFSYMTLSRNAEIVQPLPEDFDPVQRYDAQARTFDSEVKWQEYFWGISTLRRRMTSEASGHVLESAAGTGRNAGYFEERNCKSITFMDPSGPMLEVARKKWEDSHRFSKEEKRVPVRWLEESTTGEVPMPEGQPVGYDVVIQTMGLCSTEDPVEMLKSLGRLGRPGGRILLLDHGRFHYDTMNKALDGSATDHAKKYGCWWNRDIEAIVRESGLEVVEQRRHALGTMYEFELKPFSREDRQKMEATEAKSLRATTSSPPKPKETKSAYSWWWRS
ncbi:S-adenosyl-L-methionine-dependent methyltransferase [Eremomyces bilateralis CBS 781.70]|uniref:S-adenosyl-L-methionine-dependent methyltransferase n=1 Tax=Eremomyces bilateralis CBS 781.70 TaxID=1392243 RepID=A0A6G1GB65_9PEZI|nr:S-adenosyl-L-methionine-dependent methyltransferase [Eremomyces bilateralis CBS 781.70]KAF1815150.1 S-adenosyl-L-methionine-dependent methyltransferase [Eremomyces bilateralis CBS 781.70]